jgi:hypothetical protein
VGEASTTGSSVSSTWPDDHQIDDQTDAHHENTRQSQRADQKGPVLSLFGLQILVFRLLVLETKDQIVVVHSLSPCVLCLL